MLSAHYRSPLNFSADLMEAAKNGLERIVTAAENLRHLSANTFGEMTDEEKALFEQAGQYVEKFEAAMDDDFNTADGISAIFEYVKFCNTNASGENSKAYIDALYERLAKLCDVMGILIEKEEEHLDDEIEALIAKRQEARAAKDFAKADEIRDQLLAMGIILKDTREGVTWKRA
jgi:cysteinyl-tRNA synthetase